MCHNIAIQNYVDQYYNVPTTSVLGQKSAEPHDVLSKINKLDSRFRHLYGRILSKLGSKKVPLRKLVPSLTLLPVKLRQEYAKAISERLQGLHRKEEASDLFYHLNPLVNFLDYHLIKFIIDQFGSSILRSMMNSYSDDVLVFKKETTVKQLIDHWPGQQEIIPNFSKLRVEINKDPTTYTLDQLDQLRRDLCGEFKLAEVVLVITGLEVANSCFALWLIHSTFVPHLMESTRKPEFWFYIYLHESSILKVMVDEKQVYPALPDSKQKVPALLAAAATVTVTHIMLCGNR